MATIRWRIFRIGVGVLMIVGPICAQGAGGEGAKSKNAPAASGNDQANPPASSGNAGNAQTQPPTTPTIPDEFKEDVDLLIGIGSQITSPAASNYQVVNNAVLQEVNLGAATPQIMTGLSFNLPWRMYPKSIPDCLTPKSDGSTAGAQNGKPLCSDVKNLWMAYPWRAFVSLKFAPGSVDVLNGYVLGLTYRVSNHLDLLGGYTLTPFQEVAPGFQAAAVQAITASIAANTNLYPSFDLNKIGSNAKHAFDGFPLQKQGTGAQGNLFAGNPLTQHYRGGLIIGVAIPFSLSKAVFGSGGAQSGK